MFSSQTNEIMGLTLSSIYIRVNHKLLLLCNKKSARYFHDLPVVPLIKPIHNTFVELILIKRIIFIVFQAESISQTCNISFRFNTILLIYACVTHNLFTCTLICFTIWCIVTLKKISLQYEVWINREVIRQTLQHANYDKTSMCNRSTHKHDFNFSITIIYTRYHINNKRRLFATKIFWQ